MEAMSHHNRKSEKDNGGEMNTRMEGFEDPEHPLPK